VICTVGHNNYLNASLLTLVNDDCQKALADVPSQSVDLVFTSPPYADRRKDKYKSVHPDEYVEWFCVIGAEIKRILKPSGSFMLNLKAACDRGERLMYAYESDRKPGSA
jgi:site-specific DNA-methyltransferase (adenine-specific)